VDVSESASISTGIAARYATAIFELAKDDGALADLERDVDTIEAALGESADLRDLISSPIYPRDDRR
jgi:F-type H+-transporting ATPase subunit delta